MIHNDKELEGTQERIIRFQRLLAAARRSETPGNYVAMSQGYLLEIDKMQSEIRQYLSQVAIAEAA